MVPILKVDITTPCIIQMGSYAVVNETYTKGVSGFRLSPGGQVRLRADQPAAISPISQICCLLLRNWREHIRHLESTEFPWFQLCLVVSNRKCTIIYTGNFTGRVANRL